MVNPKELDAMVIYHFVDPDQKSLKKNGQHKRHVDFVIGFETPTANLYWGLKKFHSEPVSI